MLSGLNGVRTGLNGRVIEPVLLATVISKKKALSQEYFTMANMLAR